MAASSPNMGRRLVALQGDKLDLLLWREAGIGPSDLGRVLDANPGLADLGPFLPVGTPVFVPAAAAGDTSRVRALVQLWD